MIVLINITIFFLIGVTIWFFFMKKEEKATKAKYSIKITVDGGYQPSVVEVVVGKPITLEFFRKDESSCLEEVVIRDFNIRQFLPIHQSTQITITPQKVGDYQFHCGMSMFFGKIKVVNT